MGVSCGFNAITHPEACAGSDGVDLRPFFSAVGRTRCNMATSLTRGMMMRHTVQARPVVLAQRRWMGGGHGHAPKYEGAEAVLRHYLPENHHVRCIVCLQACTSVSDLVLEHCIGQSARALGLRPRLYAQIAGTARLT